MRRVLIAIVIAGAILTGVAGCFESGSIQPPAAEASSRAESSTPVAFDLFGERDDAQAEEVEPSRVEHAVFWRTESGIPEAQPLERRPELPGEDLEREMQFLVEGGAPSEEEPL